MCDRSSAFRGIIRAGLHNSSGTPLRAVQASQLVTQLSPMLEVVVDLTVMAVCVCL